MAEENTKDGTVVSDLHSLLQSGEDADVTLVVGDSQLPAHSLILAARSPVFAAMLRNDMQEACSRRIEISDMQEAVMRQLLCFMYTDTAPQLATMAAELLVAADKYDLPLLKNMCEQKLSQDLNVDNAAATAVLAWQHSCPGLKSAAVDFIATHPDVMVSGSWMIVLRGNVEAALQISSLVVEAASRIRASSVQQTSCVTQTQNLAECLIRAARQSQVGELQRLLASGAPVNARDGSGSTALHLAVANTDADTVKCLVNVGAGVNATDASEQTPLHLAVNRGDLKILWLLLTTRVQLNARDRWGKTPLHWAAASKKVEPARMLLLAGAHKRVSDKQNFYPEDVATSFTKELFSTYY